MNYAEHLDRTFGERAWHGPTLMDLLEGVTAKQANTRPLAQFHTIAELTYHITAWKLFAIKMLEGEFSFNIEIDSDQDWPRYDTLSEEEWSEVKASLLKTQKRLVELMRSATDEQLDGPIGDRPFPLRVVVEGVLDHDVYHGGQISMLKKLTKTD